MKKENKKSLDDCHMLEWWVLDFKRLNRSWYDHFLSTIGAQRIKPFTFYAGDRMTSVEFTPDQSCTVSKY